ncbi:hypothetical protein SH611_15415 [Geminicoccaceae bacterium 1502E]|nr:hypothetical protein [Geminicoccaceae bacterium 1502E]
MAVRAAGHRQAWQRQALAALGEVAGLTDAAAPDGAELVLDLGDSPPAGTTTTVLAIRDEDGLGPDHLGAGAVSRGRTSVVVRLIAIAPDGHGRILEEASLRLASWRWHEARTALLETVATWPARAVGREHAFPSGPAIAVSRRPALPPPAWRRRLGELRALAGRATWRFFEDQWAIGIVDAPVAFLLAAGELPRQRVRWLAPPPGGFVADPMVVPDERGACPTVLAELFLFREGRGKIVALDTGSGAPPATVLERPWHLSYPFLLRHGGELYCLPEMFHARRAQLFRADPFPSCWAEGPVLLEDFAAVDGTVHHDGERFWLFCANQDDEPEAKLFLFFSEDLFSGWKPHPGNPVRHDLRNSRPAGPLFAADGALWRPAQDCTATYGGAVVVNRVLELTPTRFVEEAAIRLSPDPEGPWPDGLHTLCAAGPVTIVDGKRRFVMPLRGSMATARALWRKAGDVVAAWHRRRDGRGGDGGSHGQGGPVRSKPMRRP